MNIAFTFMALKAWLIRVPNQKQMSSEDSADAVTQQANPDRLGL